MAVSMVAKGVQNRMTGNEGRAESSDNGTY